MLRYNIFVQILDKNVSKIENLHVYLISLGLHKCVLFIPFSIKSIPSCHCGHRLGDLWSLRSGVLREKSWFERALKNDG